MTGSLVAGVDCSTQATKVLVVDTDDGTVVAEGRAEHAVTGTGGARETDPAVWQRALTQALAATGRAADIAAVSVAGQQHGLVVTGHDGAPLRPAMLWNDTRSAPDAAALVSALGGGREWAQRVGSVPVASFTVTTWAWLRRTEPDIAAAAAAVCLPHDHLTRWLTGRAVTDRGDASGTGWWSTATGGYDDTVLSLPLVDLDAGLLPDVLAPDEPAGEVTGAAASALGLSSGTIVGPGTGDNMGAALGLGLEPGTPVVSLGTSGTVYAVSQRRPADPTGVVAGFADATGRFLPLAATLNCTLAVDRFAALLGIDREAVDSGGEVVVLPYLDGERTPNLPDASGTVTGLRTDTTPGQVLRAAYEGAAASLLEALGAVADQAGGLAADAPLLLIGGGARGRVWREVVGRLSGRPLVLPEASELVALGAAVQAAAVLTGATPAAVAARWDTRRGGEIDAVDTDEASLERVRSARSALLGQPA